MQTNRYELTNTIPLPTPKVKKQRGAIAKYPFRTMNVGDSFFVPKKDAPAQCLHSGAWRIKKLEGKEFMVRARAERGVKGTRVWRIK